MKKNGFTLVELLAVIVVLGVIILIASTNVFGQLNKSREVTSDIAAKNLEDAALSYAMDKYSIPGKADFMPNSCALHNEISSLTPNGNCIRQVTVQQLIDLGFFVDTKGACNKSAVLNVYKYTTNNGDKDIYSFKAYLPDNICKY